MSLTGPPEEACQRGRPPEPTGCWERGPGEHGLGAGGTGWSMAVLGTGGEWKGLGSA